MKAISLYNEFNQGIDIIQINDNQVVIEVNQLPVIILNKEELSGFAKACIDLQEVIEKQQPKNDLEAGIRRRLIKSE